METPFDRITHAMAETSSRPEDLEWAQTAYGYLINRDVKLATAESAVMKVIREVTAEEKSAQDIHGDPLGPRTSQKLPGLPPGESAAQLNLTLGGPYRRWGR